VSMCIFQICIYFLKGNIVSSICKDINTSIVHMHKYIMICVTIHEKVPSLSGGVRASAT